MRTLTASAQLESSAASHKSRCDRLTLACLAAPFEVARAIKTGAIEAQTPRGSPEVQSLQCLNETVSTNRPDRRVLLFDLASTCFSKSSSSTVAPKKKCIQAWRVHTVPSTVCSAGRSTAHLMPDPSNMQPSLQACTKQMFLEVCLTLLRSVVDTCLDAGDHSYAGRLSRRQPGTSPSRLQVRYVFRIVSHSDL